MQLPHLCVCPGKKERGGGRRRRRRERSLRRGGGGGRGEAGRSERGGGGRRERGESVLFSVVSLCFCLELSLSQRGKQGGRKEGGFPPPFPVRSASRQRNVEREGGRASGQETLSVLPPHPQREEEEEEKNLSHFSCLSCGDIVRGEAFVCLFFFFATPESSCNGL